jgi:hypothetical protein
MIVYARHCSVMLEAGTEIACMSLDSYTRYS